MCTGGQRSRSDVAGRSHRWSRWRAPGRWAAAAGAATASALVLGACSDEPPPAYDAAFRVEFISACRSSVDDDIGEDACSCWYERLSMEVEFEELPALDDLTDPEAEEDVVDPEIYERLADCVRAFGTGGGAPLTAPPPLTVPRPTTTTTLPPEG